MADYDVESVIRKIVGNNETAWSPQEKIPLIATELEQQKSDLRLFLENCDFNIDTIYNESSELCAESKELIEEMEKCKKEIEQETMAEIHKSMENHDLIAKQLESVNFTWNIVSDIVKCGKYVKNFDEGREVQSFSKAVESVYDMLKFIETPSEGFEQLDLYANTKNTARLILDSLLNDLSQVWYRMILYSSQPADTETVIRLNLTIDASIASIDVLIALDKCEKLSEKISEFADFLKKEVFVPILNHECTVYVTSDEIAMITIKNRQNYKPPYGEVLTNMKLLLHFLNNKFNVDFEPDKSIMTMLGSLIATEFCDMMIKDCFVDTIPNNINDLQRYGLVTNEIADFQNLLTVLKIFPAEGLSLLSYMERIDVLFSERSSQHFLETARTIMMKDLSMTMSIGVEKIPDDPISFDIFKDDPHIVEGLEVFNKSIPKSLFYFPRCMISKTAQELLDLVYILMEQATQCSDVVSRKLYYTARLVFELYDAVVPYHHENYLQTIPQYVALFHNNCMFLAHNLQTLGHKWLSLMECEPPYAVGFTDLVQRMRALGHRHLAAHMQQQRKQILDNIRSSDLNCIVVKDVLSENAEAAVRQCLRQLQLLKNVWIGVFPLNVFTRLMGTLVNMFMEELIHRVCTVEDISMEMAIQLTDMYTLVVQKSPTFFQSQSDVGSHVKSWIKMQELIFVLGGSLKDIENHWNDGHGPLAIHFQREELRNLIKALFQNTQFRANLLAKIK